MKSVAESFPRVLIHLLLALLLPVGAIAAQVHSSVEVSVQVVRGAYSMAPAALIEAVSRAPARPAINSGAECEAIGNKIIVDGALATCSWDSASHVYWVTVQY